MKIRVHDFSGHPFQAELSRELAHRGHAVEHVSCDQYVSGKGHLQRLDDDAPTLSFAGMRLGLPFEKYSPITRIRYEARYGKAWIRRSKDVPSEVTIASNVPLISHFRWAVWARLRRHPWIFWHQDIYSAGLGDEARNKLPRPLAALAARVFDRMERYCARTAAHVVAIGDGFTGTYRRWGVDPGRVSVIPNWAPLGKIFPTERDNPRSADLFGDDATLRLVYAGTIGRKHNPQLLVELLDRAAARGVKVSLTVVSEGDAAADLAQVAVERPELDLRVLPFQPADDLPYVLGASDVLVALLEPDATAFSIPSKVLSYMAAGRPILGLMPTDNPAAQDILASGGCVAEPTPEGAGQAAEWLATLAGDPAAVAQAGRRAREIAEEKFEVGAITARFDAILAAAEAGAVPAVDSDGDAGRQAVLEQS